MRWQMNGGSMNQRLTKLFALSSQGANGLKKASIKSFIGFIVTMFPMFLLMHYTQNVLLQREQFLLNISILAVGILIVVYLALTIEYNALYTTTYKESADLRIEITDILKNLPLSYFSKHNLSDIAQIIMEDVAAIEHAMSHAIPQMIGFTFFLCIIIPLLIIGNPYLGLSIAGIILLSIVLIVASKKIQAKVLAKHYEQLRTTSERFQETIEMQQELKSYGLIQKQKELLFSEIEKGETIHLEAEIWQAGFVTAATCIIKLMLPVVMILGTYFYANHSLSLLYFVGYLLCATKIMGGLEGLFFNMAEVIYLDSRIKRINEIRNVPMQEGTLQDIPNYDIVLDNVSFGYNEERNVVNHASFTAKEGEVTALVGASGCGKTTILRLVSRLYDYTDGEIRIGNQPIRNLNTDVLFEKIAIVFQDVTLFNNSIFENIKIGKKTATDQEVLEAARLAGCDDFVLKMEHGYETWIGENGSRLSGGERQRISIARAILKDAPIIILDEIAASLDVENEKKIQDSFHYLLKGKTVIIISHRLKAIEKADKIVVLKDGSVESYGTHEQLLKQSPTYQTLIEKSNLAEQHRYVTDDNNESMERGRREVHEINHSRFD